MHQLVLQCQRQQHQTKFPRRGKCQSRSHRITWRAAEKFGQSRNHCKLCRQQHHQSDEHPRQLRVNLWQIQLHPHRDEEKPQQNVLKWLDVFFNLHLKLGLRDQHARHKSPQSQRQPCHFSQPREAQGHQKQIEHEQLLRAPLRHQSQPCMHGFLPQPQQQGQDQCRFQQPHTHQHQQTGLRVRQSGNQNQQGHNR